MHKMPPYPAVAYAPKAVKAALTMFALLWLIGLVIFIVVAWFATTRLNDSVRHADRMALFFLLGLSILAFGFFLIRAISEREKLARAVMIVLLVLWTIVKLRFLDHEHTVRFDGFYCYFAIANGLLFLKSSSAWFDSQ
jgi:putative copper export protein